MAQPLLHAKDKCLAGEGEHIYVCLAYSKVYKLTKINTARTILSGDEFCMCVSGEAYPHEYSSKKTISV